MWQLEYHLVSAPDIRRIIRNSDTRYDILTAVNTKFVSCDLKPCGLVGKYKRFSLTRVNLLFPRSEGIGC